ncbi:MAG: hypothetical protein AAGB15_06425 [Pseudomonadota bacterium]
MNLDDDDEGGLEANRYSVWPTLIGLAAGAGLTVFMFALADGFA